MTSTPFYTTYITLPKEDTAQDGYIADNPKYFPFLQDALDGTHITAWPPSSIQARFHNRKGGITQNVLAATSFDMCFLYILSGWEGSASDGGVFLHACLHDLKIPKGKYYLADAGYAICDSLLVPFRGVRYHLREWEASGSWYAGLCSIICVLTYQQAQNL